MLSVLDHPPDGVKTARRFCEPSLIFEH